MSYSFTATEDYFISQKSITILVKFARDQDKKGNQNNRSLFLKLSIVTLVTKFQVYVENVLKEFDYKLKQTHKLNKEIPLHYRLNSFKLETMEKPIHIRLENPTEYDTAKFKEISSLISLLGDWCNENNQIHPDLKFETKFPLGATGLKELKKLFKQIDGNDIFAKTKFDIEKLNEILRRRHDIIHEDKNQQITELTVVSYKKFMEKVVKHIDRYLNRIIN
jgi:hypothetical protein